MCNQNDHAMWETCPDTITIIAENPAAYVQYISNNFQLYSF